jgi:hypothetical protein
MWPQMMHHCQHSAEGKSHPLACDQGSHGCPAHATSIMCLIQSIQQQEDAGHGRPLRAAEGQQWLHKIPAGMDAREGKTLQHTSICASPADSSSHSLVAGLRH